MSLDEQIAAVAREIALRKAVYPGFVKRGKMKQEKADHEIAAMEAVIETLKADPFTYSACLERALDESIDKIISRHAANLILKRAQELVFRARDDVPRSE